MPENVNEAAATDPAARARHLRMLELIRVNAILKHRKDAVEILLEANQKELQLLMNDAKMRKLPAHEGTAVFTADRCFAVIDHDVLMKTFTKQQLALGFKPTATFVDAAAKAGINVGAAIRIGTTPGFEVRRATNASAKAEQERIVEETRRELEETVNRLAAELRASTQD